MDRNSLIVAVVALVITILFFSHFEFIAHGTSQIAFTPTDIFDIPGKNGSISFTFAGTYEQASLEDDVWSFVNLQLNNSRRPEKFSFKVAAENSIVNITTFLIYNSTFAGEIAKGGFFRYTVAGKGKQIFNLSLDPNKGDWSVIRNGEWLGQNQGWSLSSDGTLTVTEATGNVVLAYYGFPGSFGESENSFSQPFLNQHSVSIITIIVVIVIVFFAVAIRTKKTGE